MGKNKVQHEIQRYFVTVQDSEEIEIILLKKNFFKCLSTFSKLKAKRN
jgi:hypothetical protein